MNPINNYQFPPTRLSGNQFLAFRQPAVYMTDERPNSDMYAYYINNAVAQGAVSGHQLRQYLQDNGNAIQEQLFNSTRKQFLTLEPPGAPNSCTGAEGGVIFSGGKPLVNNDGIEQMFAKDCGSLQGTDCMMVWKNTPLPQQGPHCRVPPDYYYPPEAYLG